MPATDVMLADLEREANEASSFIDDLVDGARNEGREVNEHELALIDRHRQTMTRAQAQIIPLREAARVQEASRAMHADIAADAARRMERNDRLRNGQSSPVEYRSAGHYISDMIRGRLGDAGSMERVEYFNRAAAHQTTPDNPGLLPERLLTPILGQLAFSRPLVTAIGTQQLTDGSWSRPRITQHTQVAKQTAEKTELASRKMVIGKVPVEADTFGGYVNVSRQNIDWTQPQVLDIVIADLTNEYAYETEAEAGTVLGGAAQAGPALPATPTAQDVANALWEAAGLVFGNMWTVRQPVGRLVLAAAPDMLGLIGPLFNPINPQNAQSTGFNASTFGEGTQGAISGITVTVSGAIADGTALVFSSNAVEAWEDRIGALQVVEPSVLGTQVAYAGYFGIPVLEPTGIVKITGTP